MVNLNFASWNQLGEWLRQVDSVAGGLTGFRRLGLRYHIWYDGFHGVDRRNLKRDG